MKALWRSWPAIVVITLTACARIGSSPPVPAASTAACRVPDVDIRSWRVVDDSLGVTYRLPNGFVEVPSDERDFREFRVDQTLSGRVMIGFSPSRDSYVTLRRVPSPGMLEMSECVDSAAGRQLLLQAWRMEGGVFRGGERGDLYEVMALVPVEATRTLFVTGGGLTPRFQEILLAIARSVEIDRS